MNPIDVRKRLEEAKLDFPRLDLFEHNGKIAVLQ